MKGIDGHEFDILGLDPMVFEEMIIKICENLTLMDLILINITIVFSTRYKLAKFFSHFLSAHCLRKRSFKDTTI